MTALSIDTSRMKSIRKARKIGRPKLAKLIGMTERQVARIETTPGIALPEGTMDRLSAALHVPVLTLTGELPMAEDDLKPVEKSTCSSGCCG